MDEPPGYLRAEVGTSCGRARSAILVPVPEADAAVGPWRHQYDPAALAGVPAHVTLIVPWVAPQRITGGQLAAVGEVAAATAGWAFDLVDVAWFGRRVMWLVPQPAEPFKQLTAALAERFGTPPWAGEFAEVVPHLTVAHAPVGDVASLEPVVKDLLGHLPITCRARELWVMVPDGDRWEVHARCPLG